MSDLELPTANSEFGRELKAARQSIAVMLREARRLDGEVKKLHLVGRDASEQEFALSTMLAATRDELTDIVDKLQAHSGEQWAAGLRVSHFGREVRSARESLAASSQQLDRLNFLTNYLIDGVEVPPLAAPDAL